ncbi:hypothetical protein BS47DRAFT_1381925 [Hydnum rufescens UP504]|uniref:Uncharacterized protein n=1 Tax=Hydnum rufescens UP504 TaxID=1448309 RepID=A0A9P6DUV0_9AGAM|nr:hypothetical protein BS47DRAFT_1381925 [Hydnum rufescens UP504]
MTAVSAHAVVQEIDNKTDKVAIVTGASSGIGRKTAIALSSAGWKVALFARRESELRITADSCRWETLIVPGDVSKEEDVARLFTRTMNTFGRLDLLFNNAGINSKPNELGEIPLETFQLVLNINLVGSFLCSQEAFKIFKKQGAGGRIINNGSLSAQVPRLHLAAYTISKHAISGLTKSTALDGRPYNIAVTQIDIGNAATNLGRSPSDGSAKQTGRSLKNPRLMQFTLRTRSFTLPLFRLLLQCSLSISWPQECRSWVEVN